MEAAGHLITAIASVLWPLIVLIILWRIAPILRAIAESAKERGFTVEIAGQKLTMQELTRQQGNTIGDLLAQVAALRTEVDALSAPGPASRTYSEATNTTTPLPATAKSAPRRIMWVDDRPKNNSYLVSQLQQLGILVDQVLSTRAAISAFAAAPYDAVISDMGRDEGGTYNATAGIDVTMTLRAQAVDVPIIIYCAAAAAQRHGAEARAAGASGVTSSPTELLKLLGLDRMPAA